MRGCVIGTLALALALPAAAGCRIGEGEGEVTGEVHVTGCLGSGDERRNYDNRDYSLDPQFFAAEPIDDPSRLEPRDILRIRVQHTGANIENADALLVSILDLSQVAGHLGEPIPVYAAGDINPYGVTGEQPVTPVRVALSLLRTCSTPEKDRIATGVLYADTDVRPEAAWSSSITFTQLGKLRCDEVDGRTVCTEAKQGFKVEYGDRIKATFDLDLVDLRPEYLSPDYTPLVSGHVTGNFDFVMRRGRVAQMFP